MLPVSQDGERRRSSNCSRLSGLVLNIRMIMTTENGWIIRNGSDYWTWS